VRPQQPRRLLLQLQQPRRLRGQGQLRPPEFVRHRLPARVPAASGLPPGVNYEGTHAYGNEWNSEFANHLPANLHYAYIKRKHRYEP
jgi:hypothetical protein